MCSVVNETVLDGDMYGLNINMDFPCGLVGKESTCNARDLGSIPGLGRPHGGGHGNPFQYSCLENPQGQRNLTGYSPWGRKELDTTEQLSSSININLVYHIDMWVAQKY